jgi:beta-lactamase regulating signal transducer with metallopeptidase domain
MTSLADRWVVPWLAFLAEWSVRWGLVLAVLTIWFALRPPRRAAVRHLLCAVGLTVGLLLPLTPRSWVATVTWPYGRVDAVARSIDGAPSERIDPRFDDSLFTQGAQSNGQLSNAVADPLTDRTATLDESGRRRLNAASAWRLVAIGITGVWLLVAILLMVRLIGGRLMLAKLRSTTSHGGEAADQLFDECRRSLRLTRPVALAVHSAVGSPVAMGGRRALIIVPPDWEGWTEQHRRACLLHELTHLARRDDWVKFVQEIIRVPFFFHPLVRWVLNRLDRERELLCDENVVALGADPVGYARLLLDLARRPGRLLPACAALRPGWLPFFDSRTVAVRIEHLLEDDVMRSLTPLPARRLVLLGVVAFTVALGVGGLRVRAVEARERPEPSPTAKATPAKATTRKIEGLIRGPDGKVVADAVVVAGIVGTVKPNHQIFKTNKYGRFAWWIPESTVTVYFVAYKEGLAPVTWMR